MKPQSFIINALIAVLVLAIIAWYAHSIRMKRRDAAEMQAIMERFSTPDNPIRDLDSLLLASRGRKTDGMIGYAPFAFHEIPVAVMLVFPPESPTRPSAAQLAAYHILLEEYDDTLAEDMLFAASDHAHEDGEGDLPTEEGNGRAGEEDPLEALLDEVYSPVLLYLQATEEDGVAFATFSLFAGMPPVRHDVRVHGVTIVNVHSQTIALENVLAGSDFDPAGRAEGR